MHHQRLQTLANFLRTLDPVAFNMENWVGHIYDDDGSTVSESASDVDITVGTRPKALAECGYAACAVGWACAIPEFQEQGLSMSGGAPRLASFGRGWNAVTEFFDVTHDDAEYLFNSEQYQPGVQPVTVADRITEFLNQP